MISASTCARRWQPASGIQERKLSGITLGVNPNTKVEKRLTGLNLPQREDSSGFCLWLALAGHHPLVNPRVQSLSNVSFKRVVRWDVEW